MIISYFDKQAFIDGNTNLAINVSEEEIVSGIERGFYKFHKDFSFFNEAEYLLEFKDIASAVESGFFKSGFEHFCKAGYIAILYGMRYWKKEAAFPFSKLKDIYNFSYPDQNFEVAPFFDPKWYKETYTNVDSPLMHYLSKGWKENYHPTYKFDIEKYLDTYPDVEQSGMEPLYHYLYYGKKKGYKFSRSEHKRQDCIDILNSGLFFEDWILEKNRHLSSVDILLYYCEKGYKEDLDPNPFFDSKWYREIYKLGDNDNPLLHYIYKGCKNNYNTSEKFDCSKYLEVYSEVKKEGKEPLAHFLHEGRNKNYKYFPVISEDSKNVVIPKSIHTNNIELFGYKIHNALIKDKNIDKQSTIHFVMTDFKELSQIQKNILDCIWQLEWDGYSICLWIDTLTFHESDEDIYEDIVKHYKTIRSQVKIIDNDFVNTIGNDLLILTEKELIPQFHAKFSVQEIFYLKDKSVNNVTQKIQQILLDTSVTMDKMKFDDSSVKASVIIPTYNGGELFKKVLSMVGQQKTPWNFEIIVIDSESTDGTSEYLETVDNIQFIKIKKSQFRHGKTRNFGIESASGEFIAFLTQDAVPNDAYWLYNFVTLLEHYPNAAGAFGKQIPHDNANIFTKEGHNSFFRRFEDGRLRTSYLNISEKDDLDVATKKTLHFYSNSNSCMRRSIWRKIPFKDVTYGEDQLWANDILEAGYDKVFAVSAVVEHSHEYDINDAYFRAKIDLAYYKHFFGYNNTNLKSWDKIYMYVKSLGLSNGVSDCNIKNNIKIAFAKQLGSSLGEDENISIFF